MQLPLLLPGFGFPPQVAGIWLGAARDLYKKCWSYPHRDPFLASTCCSVAQDRIARCQPSFNQNWSSSEHRSADAAPTATGSDPPEQSGTGSEREDQKEPDPLRSLLGSRRCSRHPEPEIRNLPHCGTATWGPGCAPPVRIRGNVPDHRVVNRCHATGENRSAFPGAYPELNVR